MNSLIDLLPRVFQFLGSSIVFVVVIALLIFVHELGHFTAAKLLGVKVKEFAIGFGNSLYKKKRGETVYKLNLIPLGGYVSLEGEEHRGDESESDPRNFQSKPIWAKAIILLAGIFMNVVFAIVLIAIYLPMNNYQTQLTYLADDYNFIGAESNTTIAVFVNEVIEGSPAEGNLEKSNVIYSLNGEAISSQDAFLANLEENAGEKITLGYYVVNLDSGQITGVDSVSLTLNEKEDAETPLLGVSFSTQPIAYHLQYPASIFSSVPHTINVFNYQLTVLGDSLARSISERDVNIIGDQVGSVAAVGAVIDQQLNNSEFDEVVNIAALVSLSLAFFNILPLPVLDGGQLVIYLIEAIFRRRLPENIINQVNQATFVILILLSVVLIFRDFIRFQFFEGIINAVRTVTGS